MGLSSLIPETKAVTDNFYSTRQRNCVSTLSQGKASFFLKNINHPIFYTFKLLGIAWEIICSPTRYMEKQVCMPILNLF